jgi:hypothetical protein
MGDHPVDLQAFYAAQHADDERNCQKRQNESFFHKKGLDREPSAASRLKKNGRPRHLGNRPVSVRNLNLIIFACLVNS